MNSRSGSVNHPLKTDLLSIFQAGLDAACPRLAVSHSLSVDPPFLVLDRGPAIPKLYDLESFRRIWVLGAGKAAAAMVQGVQDVLGDHITGGIVVVPEAQGASALGPVQLVVGNHPQLGTASLSAGEALSQLASGLSVDDLCIALVSGGASSLIFKPREGLDWREVDQLIEALAARAAPIHEINAIRRCLCDLKGGRLGQSIHPAELLTLVVSDIVGNPLSDVGSGPTIPSPAPYDPMVILERYQLLKDLSPTVKAALEAPQLLAESMDPKATEVQLILDNTTAILGCAAKAQDLGYEAITVSCTLQGEAREIGEMMANAGAQLLAGDTGLTPPALLIFGGETTVTVRGRGQGGRNQELALAAASGLSGLKEIALLSAGTDGDDGGTGVAGAYVDGTSCHRLESAGASLQQLLEDNDSHQAFQILHDAVVTGVTGTNVMDLQLLLAGPPNTPTKLPALPG